MDDLVIEVFKSVATQGPLVGFLFYLYIQNGKTIEAKDDAIAALNKELRDNQEKHLTKTYESINNNTIAFSALKEALIKNV